MMRMKKRSALSLKAFAIAASVMMFASTLVNLSIVPKILFNLSALLLLLMGLITAANSPSIRMTKAKGTLQAIMSFGIRSSYVWLFLGLTLYLIQQDISRGFMDSATHSIAIGFLRSFIILHSPVFFPLILKISADAEKVRSLLIYGLNAAAAFSVVGNIVSRSFCIGSIFLHFLRSGYFC